MKTIGLIPAGGIGSRLGNTPFSKEVMPVGMGKGGERLAVSEYLLSYYKNAGIENVYFIIREGKWDIPSYFKDGADFGLNISYLIMNLPYGAPYTLNQAYPFIKDTYVALGFPDIIIKPENSYLKLKDKIDETEADIVLGIYPIENYKKWDMVDFDDQGNIKEICIKQNRPLKYGWTNIIWGPKFTEFMNDFLNKALLDLNDGKININNTLREPYVGDVIIAAMKEGLKTDYVLFEDGDSVDLGTQDDLRKFMYE